MWSITWVYFPGSQIASVLAYYANCTSPTPVHAKQYSLILCHALNLGISILFSLCALLAVFRASVDRLPIFMEAAVGLELIIFIALTSIVWGRISIPERMLLISNQAMALSVGLI